jgi:hypothetical protein
VIFIAAFWVDEETERWGAPIAGAVIALDGVGLTG